MDLWSTETGGEPIHHYQSPGGIQVMALSQDSTVLGSVTGPNIRLDHTDDQGYWRTLHQTRLPKAVRRTNWFLTTLVCSLTWNDVCMAGRGFGFGAWQGNTATTGSPESRRECVPLRPQGREAVDHPLCLRSPCDLPRYVGLPGCIWSEARRLGDAWRRKQGSFTVSLWWIFGCSVETLPTHTNFH